MKRDRRAFYAYYSWPEDTRQREDDPGHGVPNALRQPVVPAPEHGVNNHPSLYHRTK